MLIQGTKKLLTELKVKPTLSVEENTLFSWHANLITVNRRKTLVLMNDSNRYTIVLHGLKATDFKKINELILGAVKETFQAEGVHDSVIEQYLIQAKDISYSTTKNRSFIARLNKACEHVYFYEGDFNLQLLNQPFVNKQTSRLIVGEGNNKYTRPNEDLYSDLGNLVEGPIFQTEAFIFHVKLQLENHQVWRRISVPKHITFPELHHTLQIAFGWQDYHLHEFTIFEGKPFSLDQKQGIDKATPIVKLVCHEETLHYSSDIPTKMESGEKPADYLPAEMIYTYDFGDNWEHRIVLEKVIDDYEVNHPICLAGEGNAPPEDVGGELGYDEYLDIMANPAHPEHEHMKRWSRSQLYEDFDIDRVNWRLGKRSDKV
ncbi:plasmid pRiA4b ORF-3 family protein [Metabacillus sp. B2-18]|uniref:plasmid pRiA4b ORF-3 family protein n=1 Tax=Metabacillus sp. B2-18 TaxID=2897333 RepID=UPI001E5465A3|nr:plasmid pRiA4b ORF-3 family protein [Metabacillus sp. B2-18]UGB30656.1 plasmid pRiA4b ORF-3 family protein [Metabacillus sp. B2-18]